MVAQWFNLRTGLSVLSLCTSPIVQSTHVMLINETKLTLGVGVDCCLPLCDTVKVWRPVQGVLHLPPNNSLDRHQLPPQA